MGQAYENFFQFQLSGRVTTCSWWWQDLSAPIAETLRTGPPSLGPTSLLAASKSLQPLIPLTTWLHGGLWACLGSPTPYMHLVLGFVSYLGPHGEPEAGCQGSSSRRYCRGWFCGHYPHFLMVSYVIRDYGCCLRLQCLMIAFMVPSWSPPHWCICLDAATWSCLGLTGS